MLCPNCEADNRASAKFCDQCGFPLGAAEAATDLPAEPGEPKDEALAEGFEPALAAEDDASNIETDYELYQPIESENTDSIEPLDPAASAEKIIFAGQEELLSSSRPAKVDLAGFDRHADEYEERLARPEHSSQPASFRDGGTIQMPRVDSDEPQKSHDYRAAADTNRKSKAKPVVLSVLAVAIVAAVAVFITYETGVWGGRIVPDVTGMTETDARAVLIDNGFAVRSEEVKSDDTEGLVLIMDPSSGSRADDGSEVVIHVAASRSIPDVKGKSLDDAKEALAAEGYQNVTVKKESSEKKENTVLKVSPKAGESAISSTEVVLTVAQPFTVPDVSGMLFDDAVSALKKAGLGYDVYYISSDDYPEGTIIGTDPAAGTKVEKGTYVMIQITQPRGGQLEDLVRAQFSVGSSIDKNGKSYIVESLDSVAYLGNDTVSYTITGREYLYVFGEQIMSPSTESVSGTVVFNENSEVIAIS